MNYLWITVIGTSALAFALKYIGQSVPARYIDSPRLKKVNGYIPVALLAALVSVQTFATKTQLHLDHRALGVSVAIIALLLKAPYPVVVLGAALSSALLVHFH